MTKIIGVKDVADILGISLPKAYELVNRKDFPVFKVGNRYKIIALEFEEWIQKQNNGDNKDGRSDKL